MTCYTPGSELPGATITGAPFTGIDGGTITVTLPTLSSGFAYIAVHLDYGYKGNLTGCNMDGAGQAVPRLTASTATEQTRLLPRRPRRRQERPAGAQ